MYQERDYDIIDYELYPLPGTGYRIRGPAPETLAPGEYFTSVGAAQTFGCFCEKPYPALLAESLGLSPLNFGFAGAGPRFFVNAPDLRKYVNDGEFAIVQVMSGRSEDNSLFDTGGQEYLTRRSNGERIGAEPAYRELLANESVETVVAIVAETRENWVKSYSGLLEAIRVPKILFWFSTRSPDYEESYTGDIYAFFRFTGKPISIRHRADLGGGWQEYNPYYPSPEMHAEAAGSLLEACRAVSARAPR
jgi:hypothetical protein